MVRNTKLHAASVAAVSLALLLALMPPVMAGAAPASILAVVRSGGADLSDTPGGRAILTLATGTAVDAIGRTNDDAWVMTTADGVDGWVSTASLVIFGMQFLPVKSTWQSAVPQRTTAMPGISASAAVQITGTVTTSADALNVRSGPDTNYPIVGTRAPGASVVVDGRDASSDWLQISLASGGEIGWVSASYVHIDGDVALLPVLKPTIPVPAATSTRQGTEGVSGLTGKLVFQAASGGTIYLYDFASGELRSLTTGADPAISPDGKTVAFWRQDGGEHSLDLVDVAGGPVRRVLARPEKLRSPTWSPDGRSIAFSHVNGQEICRDAGYGMCLPDVFPYNRMFPAVSTDRWSLAAVDRDGSRYRDVPAIAGAGAPNWGTPGLLYAAGGIQTTQDGGSSDANRAVLTEPRFRDPAWQPGGDRIAFQSLEKDHWEIFVASVDGKNLAALTRPATTLVPKLPQNVAPAWSPDGHSIAFLSDRSGQWAIWVMDANGANQRRLPIEAPIEYRNQGEQMLSWGR